MHITYFLFSADVAQLATILLDDNLFSASYDISTPEPPVSVLASRNIIERKITRVSSARVSP